MRCSLLDTKIISNPKATCSFFKRVALSRLSSTIFNAKLIRWFLSFTFYGLLQFCIIDFTKNKNVIRLCLMEHFVWLNCVFCFFMTLDINTKLYFHYNSLKNDKKDNVFAFYYHKIARKLPLNVPDEWNDTYPTRIEHDVKYL